MHLFAYNNNNNNYYYYYYSLQCLSTQQTTTRKCVYKMIIECSVSAKTRYDLAHRYSAISKYTVINAIFSAQQTNDTLQLTTIVCPMFAATIEIRLYRLARLATKRVEVFCMRSTQVDVDCHPVCARSVGRIQVAY